MRKFGVIVCLVFSLYSVAAIAIALYGLNDHAVYADMIVVPGNTVAPGGVPSPRLQSRLDVALQLFKERRAPLIFVSGGVGGEGYDEAAVMAGYLISKGVPTTAIIRDPSGANTAATAVNAGRYLRAHTLRSAIVATQYFHVARTELALGRNGVDVVGTVHARYFEVRDVYSLLREVLGFAVYYVTLKNYPS